MRAGRLLGGSHKVVGAIKSKRLSDFARRIGSGADPEAVIGADAVQGIAFGTPPVNQIGQVGLGHHIKSGHRRSGGEPAGILCLRRDGIRSGGEIGQGQGVRGVGHGAQAAGTQEKLDPQDRPVLTRGGGSQADASARRHNGSRNGIGDGDAKWVANKHVHRGGGGNHADAIHGLSGEGIEARWHIAPGHYIGWIGDDSQDIGSLEKRDLYHRSSRSGGGGREGDIRAGG